MERYSKVKFSNLETGETTAGLVLKDEDITGKTIADISRKFPDYDATKMKQLHISPWFDSWDQAFYFEFEG